MARILIVDDSRTSRKILRSVFEQNGFEVAGEAVDGQEGISLYKELKPDAVSMDITMPVMDGLSALHEIMEIDPKACVVMVTSAGQKSKMTAAVKYGAREFITKPFIDTDVVEVFKKVLNGE